MNNNWNERRHRSAARKAAGNDGERRAGGSERATPALASRLGNRGFGAWLDQRVASLQASPQESATAGAARLALDGPVEALGAGHALDAPTRHTYEPLLGTSLAGVRIHDDAAGASMAAGLGARAATLGSHIVFGAGQFDPHGAGGRRLLAHELAHTAQLGHLTPTLAAPFSRAGDALEHGADHAAARMLRGLPAGPLMRASSPRIARVPDGLKNQSERDAEAYNRKKLRESLASLSWSNIKKGMYDGLISGMRGAQKAAFDALRAKVADMPSPRKESLGIVIDVFDEFVGVLISLVLAVVGIVVGFGEGVIDMVIGLVNLVGGIIKWIALMLYSLIDNGEAFDQFNDEIVAAARNIVPGLKKIVADWIERFEKAPIDQGTLMIGELTGQIIALIASFGFAASKAGQVPKLSLAANVPVMTGRGELALAQVALVVDVSSPAAASALVGTQALRVVGSGGGGGGGGGRGSGDGGGEKKPDFSDLNGKEVDKALELLNEKKPPKAPAKEGRGGKKPPPAVPQLAVEDVVAQGVKQLKAQGVKGLHPSEYGSKLHAEVRQIVLQKTGQPPTGWTVAAEQPLGKVVKLRPQFADKTVEEYMKIYGMTERYPTLPEKFRGTVIKNLKPDVFVRAPNGRALVWDLTSQLDSVHLAKTMFYTELIGREIGGFFRIAESYWRKIF